MLARHFALIDANGKVIRRIPIEGEFLKEPLRSMMERRLRRDHGVDDVTLFLRDSGLDHGPW